jgi:hypothetical protein
VIRRHSELPQCLSQQQMLSHDALDAPLPHSPCRLNTWYAAHVSESEADATGVTWPAEKVTRLWKFFFKV